MTFDHKLEVTPERRKVLMDREEIFHVPMPGEDISFVGKYEDELFIAVDRGCCPPGTVYVLNKDVSKDTYELKEVYVTGLPVTAVLPTRNGVLTVAHGCYSGVRLTKRDGTRLDIIDEETYRVLRRHERYSAYGGGLEPILNLDRNKIILRLERFDRMLDKGRVEQYELAKNAGRNPFPLELEHPTDTYQSRGVVEQVDLTKMLEPAGVTIGDVVPLTTVYTTGSGWSC